MQFLKFYLCLKGTQTLGMNKKAIKNTEKICIHTRTAAGDQGQWKDGMMHGIGICIYLNGSIYAGEWNKGEWCGMGVYIDQDGNKTTGKWKHKIPHKKSTGTIYIGERKHDERHGFGVCIDSDDNLYAGEWINGKRHGWGICVYPDNCIYEGDFINDKMHGRGTCTYPEGDKYEGDWVDGMKHGKGKIKYRDGSMYEGDFINDKMHGRGMCIYSCGNKYVGDWAYGKKNGEGKFIYRDGSIYEGTYREGKLQGWGTCTYPEGDKYVGNIVDNKRNGEGTYTWSDGNIYTGPWERDAMRIDVKTPKKKNTIPTVVFRSTKIALENRPSRYETDKFLPGGEKITVIPMSDGDALDKLLAESRVLMQEHTDTIRFITDEHGRRNRTSSVEHTKEHFEGLLKLCAEHNIKETVFSDISCFSGATRHLQEAKVPDGVTIRHHWCHTEHKLHDTFSHDPQGHTRSSHRWIDKNGQLYKRHKSLYKDGEWELFL